MEGKVSLCLQVSRRLFGKRRLFDRFDRTQTAWRDTISANVLRCACFISRHCPALITFVNNTCWHWQFAFW